MAWKIHPAIGFARVGNSLDAFFYGPEAFAPSHQAAEATHHDVGDSSALRLPAVKRQAALFRLYGYDAAGKCLGEVTRHSGAIIKWGVCVANRKASATKIAGDSRARVRNPQVPQWERWRLDIVPRPRQLSGTVTNARFDDGRFMGLPVCLGEIRLDSDGRLVVLGGAGGADTYDTSRRLTSTTDNDYWYDDVSDGPVTATVVLPDGRHVDAMPAWVVVAPPNFAPGIQSVATLHDALIDHRRQVTPKSDIVRPSFSRDVLPILQRIASLQWLDRRAMSCFGSGNGRIDLPALLPVLADGSESGKAARNEVFAVISKQRALHGADCWLHMTATQFEICRLWAAGLFDPDRPADDIRRDPAPPVPDPAQLDLAALEACPAGTLFADPSQIEKLFLSSEGWRIDHQKCSAGALTEALPVPWHAAVLDNAVEWPTVNRPYDVLTLSTYAGALEALASDIAPTNTAEELQQRHQQLLTNRESWTRSLPNHFPACIERLVKEWPHLGFVDRVPGQTAPAFVEKERSPHLGTLGEYFHRLVNFEHNLDFAPKALELAEQLLGEAKFAVDANYAPFRYSARALEERLAKIFQDRVREHMNRPVAWECGEISWNAVVDYTDGDQPIWDRQTFNVGRFSDAALRERFRQFAPENMTDGAWLQNIVAAAPLGPVQSRLARIWLDEVGNGRMDESHANVYVALMHSLNVYLPPITSRDFIEQNFVESAFLSPVFQFAVGRFPKRFLPELLGMTLFMEWEATPISTTIANMMAERRMDPHYYRMHAAIDNIEAGHGALAKEAVKLYLDDKLHEGGEAAVQEHWQRIWRGYVAWATLGTGHDEVIERMMLMDRKQIQCGSSLLDGKDILPPFLAAMRTAADPVSRHLRTLLGGDVLGILDRSGECGGPDANQIARICAELNRILREGLYERKFFAHLQLSSATKDLLNRPLHRRVEIVDLGRSLLEDAYPSGIAGRTAYPDIQAHCAKAMVGLIARKADLAGPSHRPVRWLTDAFHDGPEAVMSALLKRGFIDLDHPLQSKLFEKTRFGGPMYRVLNDEDEKTVISWIASLKLGVSNAARARPEKTDASTPGSRVAKLRLNSKGRDGNYSFNHPGPHEREPWEAGAIEP